MATTAHLNLALVEQSQAQKEVTVNRALMDIDALLNTGVIDHSLATPPGSPSTGDVYIVAASATGDWAGQDGNIAYFDGIWYFITPNIELALTGIIAFTMCSLFYEWIHFFSHIPYVPKNNWLKKVQRNHRAHHFKNENYWYAFTIPQFDELFGPGPDPKNTPRSTTCKTLGVEDSFPITSKKG